MTNFTIDQNFLNHITIDHKRKLENALCECQQFQSYANHVIHQLPKEIWHIVPQATTIIQASSLIEACLNHNTMDALIETLYHIEGPSAVRVQTLENVWKTVAAEVQQAIKDKSIQVESAQKPEITQQPEISPKTETVQKPEVVSRQEKQPAKAVEAPESSIIASSRRSHDRAFGNDLNDYWERDWELQRDGFGRDQDISAIIKKFLYQYFQEFSRMASINMALMTTERREMLVQDIYQNINSFRERLRIIIVDIQRWPKSRYGPIFNVLKNLKDSMLLEDAETHISTYIQLSLTRNDADSMEVMIRTFIKLRNSLEALTDNIKEILDAIE